MSNDSDSEIECWDGLKPSASISQPVTNVPIDNAVYKAGVGPASRPIKSSPDFSRKRKRSGVSSSAQGSLFFQKSLPGRRLGDAVIDLTDNNIHVDFAIRQDSTGGNNNHVDKAKKRESPRMNSINVETLKRVKPRKSASQSFSEKRNVLLMSVRNSLIDLTDDRDTSPAKSQPPFPLASAQEPTDALYSDPINFQPQSDASSEETTANMDLQAEDGEDSSRSSWSAVSVGIKKSGSLAKNTTDRSKKRILFEDEDSDSCCLSVATQKTISHSSDEKISDEVLSEDEDSDSCLPSVATQNTASYSRGEKISQREVQAIRRPCVDNNPTVTVSPVLNDTSASSVIVRHEVGAVVPSQSNECRDKMGLIRVTTAVAKRVMPRKGSQRTTPLAEIDIDTDSETDSSLSSVMSSQPNACHDNTGDKIHAPAAVAERVTSRNGSQTTTPLAEIEIDTDWDTDVSQESETEGDEEAGIVTSICRAMGEKGYPIRYFSVYGGDDGEFSTVIVVIWTLSFSLIIVLRYPV